MNGKHIVLGASALLLSACSTVLPQPEEIVGAAAPTIQMAVDAKTGEFRITTKASEACRQAGENVNGCFEVGRNKVVFARFQLGNSPGWQLQKIRICLGENEATQNCNLTPWNRLEFVAAKNRDSEFLLPDNQGIINLADLGTDLDSFFLATQNLYEQWWYYQLQVCPSGSSPDTAADDAKCVWNVDPPMKNRGRRTL